MTAAIARLRRVPAIAFEPEEGARLRRRASEASRTTEAGGHRPRQPEARDVLMRAKILSTLAEEMYRHLRALEDLHEIELEEQLGFNELNFQIWQVVEAAAALQPN